MISNPAFLFGFYSRRVITGRKPYKRLPGNDGKDVTFHIKTTLIPSQTSNTPFLPDPSHRCHQPPFPLGVWDTPLPPHKQAAAPLCCRLGGSGPWGEDAGSPSTSPPAAGSTGEGKQAAPGRTEGVEESAPRLKLGCWCSRTLLHGVQTCSERFLGSDM